MNNEIAEEFNPVDFFGQPLKVGDTVAYVYYGQRGKRHLCKGVISKLNPKKAKMSNASKHRAASQIEYANIVKAPVSSL